MKDPLEAALLGAVDGEVRFDATARALYATDASNYRIVPRGVVRPRSVDGLIATVGLCGAHEVPVTTRGGGTSTGGQAVGEGVVIDCSRYLNKVIEIDPDRKVARVEPGTVLDTLQRAAAPHGLFFGPDPSTHDRCTVGGMIGNNACGAHSLAYGKTDDNVEALEVLLYDGSRLGVRRGLRASGPPARAAAIEHGLQALSDTYGDALRRAYAPLLPRRVSGYGLQHLLAAEGPHLARALVGSEGTCVTLLEATVALVRPPRQRVLVVLAFPDVYEAAEFVPALLGARPLTIEGIDRRVVALSEAAGRRGSVELLGAGGSWLLVEVGGDSEEEAASEGARLLDGLERSVALRGRVVTEATEQRAIWRIREDGAGLATRIAGGGEAFPGFEDAAVPPERLADYLRGFDALLVEHGRKGVHYGHYGEGCVHIRIDFDFRSSPGVAAFRRFIEDAADLVVAHSGSLSGEHGDGQARSELLGKMYAPEVLEAFKAFKGVFDPTGQMNPGLLVAPRRIDEDLRVRTVPYAVSSRTTLALTDDGGDLGAATRRCVGVGRCRRPVGGGMCPSYQVTLDEEHSTRGRARLLAEMLEGEVITDGWRSKEVAAALDLCLSCKACKSDCPVGVDMAAYKAEFLFRHWRHRLRPPAHYVLGFLPIWARLGSLAPRLANLAATSRVLAPLRRLGGLDPTRALPGLARHRFRAGAGGPSEQSGGREKVLLFPDTFTNFFEPQIGTSAREVLEALGYEVVLPNGPVCCGLTWYSTGQFTMARRVLRRTMRSLRAGLEEGLRIVTLEPSCASMLAEDAPELFAANRDPPLHKSAEALSGRVISFAALVAQSPAALGPVEGPVYAQIHCHEQASGGFSAEAALLQGLGAQLRTSTGCCGLAGNFGIEHGHEELSAAIARGGVLAQLAAGEQGEVVLADGFSCRTQIRSLGGGNARHLAELLREHLVGAPSAGSPESPTLP